MALEQKLSLKLAQKLVMTPSLQQAIKLLQMTRLELEGVLTQELVENPLLEEAEPSSEEDRAQEAQEAAQEAQDAADAKLEEAALSDVDLDAFFGDYAESWEGTGAASIYEEKEGPPLENTLSQQDDLYDNLLFQLHMTEVSPQVREIAELIIGNLDEDGFLKATVEEIQLMGADGYDASGLGAPGRGSEAAEPDPESEGHDHLPVLAADVKDALAAGAEDVGGPTESEAFATPPVQLQTAATSSAGISADESEAQPEEELDASGDEQEPEPIELPPDAYPREVVIEALELVRSFEPPGVACADLRESLLCQLERMGEEEDSLTWILVSEKWHLFTRRKFEQIAKELGLPLAKLKPVVEMISRLETRPGREFTNERTQYVEPDVHVVKVGEEYVIQLNDNGLPRLRVSRAYRQMLRAMSQKGSEEEAQQYIKEKMRSAFWLIKSLDQRQRTIFKVAESIVKQQRGFLDHGVDHLRPMVLRDVAEDIEMHESTVSRVVSNKYIHTPRGLLPMKFFFHSGIDREYGGDISSLTVKRKIQQMIQGEEPKKPLSDSELMRILKREGIQIARRTVAKYRDELGIPSSTERKRIF